MKLKRIPEDFQVEELTQFPLSQSRGTHSLYRMTKRSIGTPEAIERILQRWNLARNRVSYGGLKDTHAVTAQFLTIAAGPRQNLAAGNVQLEYLGPATRPFEARDIAGNRFHLTLRNFAEDEALTASQRAERVSRTGVPNYFDDQRFGSVGFSNEFIAKPWCLGDYERALWLMLADPNSHDRPDEREQKQILRESWGDWQRAKQELTRSHRRSVITYLVDHPTDFRGAIARYRVDLRSLYLAAFQSSLWNSLLAAWIKREFPPEQLEWIELRLGPAPFFGDGADLHKSSLREAMIPLPAARNKITAEPLASMLDEILANLGMQQRELRVKYPRDSFFSRGNRAAILLPTNLSASVNADEIYPGHSRLDLTFDLPRGSYATILIKKITQGAGNREPWDPDVLDSGCSESNKQNDDE